MQKRLILNLKKEYFDDIKSGNKKIEYREKKEYWTKRLNKDYSIIEIRMGYPKSTEKDKIMLFKWKGFSVGFIQHKVFGVNEIEVFQIDLSERVI